MTLASFDDVIGLPYREASLDAASGGLDCAGASLCVVSRILGPDAARALTGALTGERDEWRRVAVHEGEPPAPGDLVLSNAEGGGLHVSAVLPGLPVAVLSSSQLLGVYRIRLSSVTNVIGVYRFEPRHEHGDCGTD